MVTNANANNIPAYRLHSKFVKNIMDSMILWYDIKRQGATNESMAQTPVLRDLSGNGHDATCYNFAWTEESGISTTNYPNALVSDGVDDYAQVTGLPILTDYTIVAKRTDLSVIPDTVLASKRKQGVGTGDVSGAFQLERHFASNWTAFNFGSQNTINKSTDDIIYQTKSNYCGQNLSIGTAQDSDTMTLFKWNELSTVCANIALYSIMLFNRTLTAEEIEWVKTNLINYQPLFNVYSFRSANSRTQITYAVNDTLIINTTGEKGTWLVRGDINLLKTSFNITCNRPMFLSIADIGTDGNTVNKQKKYFNLQVGLNTVPAISDEDLSQYNELVICRASDDTAGEYIIKAL